MKTLKKLLFITLSLLLLLSPVSVFASDIEQVPYDWESLDMGNVISNSERTYVYYSLPTRYKIMPKLTYHHANEVDFGGYYTDSEVMSYAVDGELIWCFDDGYEFVLYATATGAASVDALIAGNREVLSIENCYNDGEIKALDGSLFTALVNNNSSAVELDSRELAAADCINIRAYDKTETVYIVAAAVYYLDGAAYFIDYDKLSERYFDSNGDFSFRTGVVSAYKLEGELLESFNSAREGNYVECTHEYEGGKGGGDYFPDVEIDSDVAAIVFFWIVFAIIGFAAPVFLGFIAIKAYISKQERRYFTLTSAICIGVWIALSIAILIILIV